MQLNWNPLTCPTVYAGLLLTGVAGWLYCHGDVAHGSELVGIALGLLGVRNAVGRQAAGGPDAPK